VLTTSQPHLNPVCSIQWHGDFSEVQAPALGTSPSLLMLTQRYITVAASKPACAEAPPTVRH